MKHAFQKIWLIISMFWFVIPAFAYDFKVDNIYYNILPNQVNVEVTYDDESPGYPYYYQGDIIIPHSVLYNGYYYSVTAIGKEAFRYSNIWSVEIPHSVTNIATGAFDDCDYLEFIEIPKNVSSIGYTFADCPRLKEIKVDSDNNYYSSIEGVLLNKDCTELIKYPPSKPDSICIIPNTVKYIGGGAFIGCKNLSSITMPDNITAIYDGTFMNCSNLKSIEISSSITYIGNHVFNYCTDLKEINVSPDNGYYASIDGVLFTKDITTLIQFPAAKAEHIYSIPNTVKYIGEDAFTYCNSVEAVEIPTTITTIGTRAFSGCSSLQSMTIPNSVIFLGSGAFAHCANLKSIILPNSITVINGGLFGGCQNLSDIVIPSSISTIEGTAFAGCSSLKTITIPNSVKDIGYCAFFNCKNLAKIVIGNSVDSIGDGAFKDCTSLKTVIVNKLVPPNVWYSIWNYGTFNMSTYNDATLFVPKSAINTYRDAEPWNYFKNIKSFSEVFQLESLGGEVGEHLSLYPTSIISSVAEEVINWQSSNPEVAAVDAEGVVWFNAAGNATVTAECQGYEFSVPFVVKAVVAKALNVFPVEAVGGVGHEFSLLALHEPENTTDKSVVWESSDPEVASVSEDGRVSLAALGSAQITARSGEHTAVCSVTVDETVGLTEMASTGVVIDIVDGGIIVRNAPLGESVAVYTVDGKVINGAVIESEETRLTLPAGIYIVKISPETVAKVLIK